MSKSILVVDDDQSLRELLRLHLVLLDRRVVGEVAFAFRIEPGDALPALQSAQCFLRAIAILLLGSCVGVRLLLLLEPGLRFLLPLAVFGFPFRSSTGPFFASLDEPPAGDEGAGGGGLSAVAFTPGGGTSPYRVRPFWSTHLYCWAQTAPASQRSTASAKMIVRFMIFLQSPSSQHPAESFNCTGNGLRGAGPVGGEIRARL